MNYIYITGTSKGIGKALAELLLKDNQNKIIGLSRHQSIQHNNYIHFNIDLSDSESLKQFKFKLPPGATRLVLINNAGSLGEVTHLGRLSAEMITKTLHANLTAPLILMNDFIKIYQHITIPKLVINITSGAAKNPYDGWGMYCTSKAGLDMATLVADAEQKLKSNAVKILGIAPGVVATDMQIQIRQASKAQFSNIEKFIKLKENNELYSPEAVALKLKDFIFNPEWAGDAVISRISI